MMEDRWLGGEGSKRQEVNNKGCLHTPPEAVLQAFVNTHLKREALAVA